MKTRFTKNQTAVGASVVLCLTLVVIGILLIVNNSDSGTGKTSSQPHAELGAEYTDTQTGLKITPPAGWNQVKPTPSGDIVDFQESQQDSDSAGNGRSTLSVITSQARGNLDQYAQAISAVNTKNLKSYQEIAPHDLTIDDQPAKILNYSATVNGRSLRTAQLIIIKDNILYDFNGIGLVSSWNKHEAEISKSFASIKLP